VLSSRPDFVPIEYVELFSTLQDSIPQWPIEKVKQIVDDSLRSEHHISFEDVFETIDPVALGSASIGQVHRAVLVDNDDGRRREVGLQSSRNSYDGASGRVVAVKVMHPNSKSCFKHDFQVFRWLCRVALPGWRGFVDEIEKRMMTEFDYRNEARSLHVVRSNMAKSPYRNAVRVPQPYSDLCTKHVLVMEMLNGKKMVEHIEDRFVDVVGGDRERVDAILAERRRQVMAGVYDPDADESSLLKDASFVTKMKLLALRRKCKRYLNLLVDVHGHQIFADGVWNADPHPVSYRSACRRPYVA